MRHFIISIALFLLGSSLFAQEFSGSAISVGGYLSSGDKLPFWLSTNKHGALDEFDRGGAYLYAGYYHDFSKRSFDGEISWRRVDFNLGVSGVVNYGQSLSESSFRATPIEGFVGAKWGLFNIDIGLKGREDVFDGLSVSNGNIAYSGNARNMPGYNFSTDVIYLPFTNRKVGFYANFADYIMLDNRYMDKTHVHNCGFYFFAHFTDRIDFWFGLEDWAQWAGTSPKGVKFPSNFNAYLRIITGMKGGSDASRSDQINVLGNHLGRELIKLRYRGDNFTITAAHDIPYNDGSGMGFQNFPDGINTIHFSFKEKNRWISDILYEYHYTKWQSGDTHDRPATPEEKAKQDPSDPFYGRIVIGGLDNYFNSGEYRSAWTHYGRSVGSPILFPYEKNSNGMTLGSENTRYVAHHIGIRGKFAKKLPYKALLTYYQCFGQYRQKEQSKYASAPREFSFAFEGEIPLNTKIPIAINYAFYGDFGELFDNNCAALIGIKYLFSH